MNFEDNCLKVNSEHSDEPISMIENTQSTVNGDNGSPNICDQVCLSASGLAPSVPGAAEHRVDLKISSDSQQPNGTESPRNGACTKKRTHRICPGHERALPIERLVQELDMKEEGMR